MNSLEQKGRDLYKKNKTLKNLANVMEHPEFRNFFDLYLSKEEVSNVIIIFMKIYKEIEKENDNLSPYEKIAILKERIENVQLRKKYITNYNFFKINES